MSATDVLVSPDPDIVRAIAWCRLGGARFGRPESDGSFYAAERLGLLAHDPIWRSTPKGDGVLIALGLLEGEPAPERLFIDVLWARRPEADAPAQFVTAWPASLRECYPERFETQRDEAKERWRAWPGEGETWLFFTESEALVRP